MPVASVARKVSSVGLTVPSSLFSFNDTATTEIYTLSLHDALPISHSPIGRAVRQRNEQPVGPPSVERRSRSEEHTSELQSHHDLVCRLLLEKKKAPSSGDGNQVTRTDAPAAIDTSPTPDADSTLQK